MGRVLIVAVAKHLMTDLELESTILRAYSMEQTVVQLRILMRLRYSVSRTGGDSSGVGMLVICSLMAHKKSNYAMDVKMALLQTTTTPMVQDMLLRGLHLVVLVAVISVR